MGSFEVSPILLYYDDDGSGGDNDNDHHHHDYDKHSPGFSIVFVSFTRQYSLVTV